MWVPTQECGFLFLFVDMLRISNIRLTTIEKDVNVSIRR